MSAERKKLESNAKAHLRREQARDKTLVEYRNSLFFNQTEGEYYHHDGDCINRFKCIAKKISAEQRAKCPAQTKEDDKEDRRLVRELLEDVTHNKSVTGAGPFAGKKTGEIITGKGARWLVSSEASLIEAKRGQWKNIRKFLKKLVGDPGFLVLCAWLQTQLRAVRSGEHTPAPMFIMTGDAGDGKSFALWIIGQLLGGRVTNPLKAWLNDLVWNDHILASECLQIDDSNTHEDYKSRKGLAAGFKETIYADSLTIVKKYSDGFSARPVNCAIEAVPENGARGVVMMW